MSCPRTRVAITAVTAIKGSKSFVRKAAACNSLSFKRESSVRIALIRSISDVSRRDGAKIERRNWRMAPSFLFRLLWLCAGTGGDGRWALEQRLVEKGDWSRKTFLGNRRCGRFSGERGHVALFGDVPLYGPLC